MADYVRVAEHEPQVENAVATLRWTGSWYTVFITAEPKGEGLLTRTLAQQLKQQHQPLSPGRAGHRARAAAYVSLEIALTICVDPDYFHSDVQARR